MVIHVGCVHFISKDYDDTFLDLKKIYTLSMFSILEFCKIEMRAQFSTWRYDM